MSIGARIRRGDNALWRGLRRGALALLGAHLPVSGPLRLLVRLLYACHATASNVLAFALRFFWYEPLFRGQCETVGRRFYMERLPFFTGTGRIAIGDGVRLSGKSSFMFHNRFRSRPELSIGDGTFIGHDCHFRIANSVRIGERCLIAAHVDLSDFDGHPLDPARRRAGEPPDANQVRRLVVGNDVWIGTGAAVLKGVVIGDRSIVGAHSVVTKEVPADVIVAGNPARIVRRLSETAAVPSMALLSDGRAPAAAGERDLTS